VQRTGREKEERRLSSFSSTSLDVDDEGTHKGGFNAGLYCESAWLRRRTRREEQGNVNDWGWKMRVCECERGEVIYIRGEVSSRRVCAKESVSREDGEAEQRSENPLSSLSLLLSEFLEDGPLPLREVSLVLSRLVGRRLAGLSSRRTSLGDRGADDLVGGDDVNTVSVALGKRAENNGRLDGVDPVREMEKTVHSKVSKR
jgi:hypothetical protein